MMRHCTEKLQYTCSAAGLTHCRGHTNISVTAAQVTPASLAPAPGNSAWARAHHTTLWEGLICKVTSVQVHCLLGAWKKRSWQQHKDRARGRVSRVHWMDTDPGMTELASSLLCLHLYSRWFL